MQTFLPYRSFARSAATLDLKRLGKQRVENLQIMTTLLTGRDAWKHHPAVLMWQGYELHLLDYQHAMCEQWVTNFTKRGVPYSDSCYEKTFEMVATHLDKAGHDVPPWLGDERVHISHQSRLIQKFPEHYRPQFPDAPVDLEYFWPVAVPTESENR
jgi:hypothetical protein